VKVKYQSEHSAIIRATVQRKIDHLWQTFTININILAEFPWRNLKKNFFKCYILVYLKFLSNSRAPKCCRAQGNLPLAPPLSRGVTATTVNY